MRRYVFLILFALVLVLPFLLRGAVKKQERLGAYTARLVIVTPHNQDIRREFERGFHQWRGGKYAHVELDFRVPGGTNDIKRLLENTYKDQSTGKLRPNPPADLQIAWGGGDYFFDREIPEGVLEPMHLPPGLIREVFPEEKLAGVKLLDLTKDAQGNPTPKWVGVCLSSFGIVYNPDLYRYLKQPDGTPLPPPTTWHDLTAPALADLIGLADPAHSGSAAVAYMMVVQRAMADAEEAYLKKAGPKPTTQPGGWERGYKAAIAKGWKQGMGELLLIAANARYFADSSSLVPNDVGNGNAAAGIAIDFYGRVYEETAGANRCRVVMPKGATAITPDPVGILIGARGEQLELANAFVEFLLSREGQRLWILKAGEPGGPADRGLRRSPIRRDVYADQSGWTDKVNPFEEAHGFNQRGAWMGLFADMRTIWVASWIDSRDSLKDAYAKVLKVKDPARREALRARLADLPVTMEQVEAMKQERESHKADVEEWKARNRIAWTKKFAAHYEQVGREAEAVGGRR